MEDKDGSVWIGEETSAIHISPPDDLIHRRYARADFISSFSWNGAAPQFADNFGSIGSGADLTAHIGSLQFDGRNALHFNYRVSRRPILLGSDVQLRPPTRQAWLGLP